MSSEQGPPDSDGPCICGHERARHEPEHDDCTVVGCYGCLAYYEAPTP